MLEKWIGRVERLALWCAIAALLLMLGITTTSVVGRYLFMAPIPDDIVFNELLLVLLVFLPLSYVQKNDQHIQVSLLSDRLSASGQNYLRLFASLSGVLFFTLLSSATYTDFRESFSVLAYNEGVLELPEYPIRFLLFFGVSLMLIRLVFQCAIYLGVIFDKRIQTNSDDSRN